MQGQLERALAGVQHRGLSAKRHRDVVRDSVDRPWPGGSECGVGMAKESNKWMYFTVVAGIGGLINEMVSEIGTSRPVENR